LATIRLIDESIAATKAAKDLYVRWQVGDPAITEEAWRQADEWALFLFEEATAAGEEVRAAREPSDVPREDAVHLFAWMVFAPLDGIGREDDPGDWTIGRRRLTARERFLFETATEDELRAAMAIRYDRDRTN
jgi:hypothetical protein